MCKFATGKAAHLEHFSTKTDNELFKVRYKLSCCKSCLYCPRAFAKERCKSWGSSLSLEKLQIKICEKCFLCHSIVLCKTCNINKNVVSNLPVGARLQNYWQTWLDLGAGPKVVQILRGLHPSLSDPAKTHKVSHNHKLLCQSPQEFLNAVELVQNQTSLSFFNRLFLVPKSNNKWRPILDLSNLNQTIIRPYK